MAHTLRQLVLNDPRRAALVAAKESDMARAALIRGALLDAHHCPTCGGLLFDHREVDVGVCDWCVQGRVG